MKMSIAFPSKYLKAADLDGREARLVMSHVAMEKMEQTKDEKPVLHFRDDAEKPLVLNVTNSNTIAKKYGDETDSWAGHEVILFATQTSFRGEQVNCVRLRIPADATDATDTVRAGASDTPF